MIAALIIVFREILEAGLIVGIVLAATRGTPRRGLWVASGITGGVAGACIVAGFADVLADAAAGAGQELFNAGVLLAAVGMLTWHNVWMARTGRAMASDIKRLGAEVAAGSRPLYAVAIVCAIAVLREGSEIALFLYGIMIGGGETPLAMLTGALLGLALGAVVSFALYRGLVAIPTRHLFTVTTWMIVLLACGMASQAVRFLAQADILTALNGQVWNTSWLLSEGSLPGKVLHTLVGYSDRPSGMQVLAYLLTLGATFFLMWLFGAASRASAPRAPAPAQAQPAGAKSVRPGFKPT